jgi:hypothetical protein
MGDGYNVHYSVWCTSEIELYDMTVRHESISEWHSVNDMYSMTQSSLLIWHRVPNLSSPAPY